MNVICESQFYENEFSSIHLVSTAMDLPFLAHCTVCMNSVQHGIHLLIGRKCFRCVDKILPKVRYRATETNRNKIPACTTNAIVKKLLWQQEKRNNTNLHIVRIEQESVFFPPKVGQRWIRAKMTIERSRPPIREVDFSWCINHFSLI